jgi:cytochrome c peroxidase
MTISKGDKLPAAKLMRMGDKGPEAVDLGHITRGRKVALFAVPGAFTPTCHSAHVPSFIRTKAEFDAKGVDEIVCVSVNDPFVMGAWGEHTGAAAAGITMVADPTAAFAQALGLTFDGAGAGLGVRSQRYSMLVENGVVKALNVEDAPGQATVTTGGALLAQI